MPLTKTEKIDKQCEKLRKKYFAARQSIADCNDLASKACSKQYAEKLTALAETYEQDSCKILQEIVACVKKM